MLALVGPANPQIDAALVGTEFWNLVTSFVNAVYDFLRITLSMVLTVVGQELGAQRYVFDDFVALELSCNESRLWSNADSVVTFFFPKRGAMAATS